MQVGALLQLGPDCSEAAGFLATPVKQVLSSIMYAISSIAADDEAPRQARLPASS